MHVRFVGLANDCVVLLVVSRTDIEILTQQIIARNVYMLPLNHCPPTMELLVHYSNPAHLHGHD